MNQIPWPFMPNNNPIDERLFSIEQELKEIKKLLENINDNLNKNKKNSYLQKDDNLYML